MEETQRSKIMRLVTVEPILFLYMLSRLMYTPLVQQYYYHTYGAAILRNTSFQFPNGSFCVDSDLIDNYTGNNDSYKQDETQSNHLVIYCQLANEIPAIITTLILGPLTDRYGRRVGILLPTTGMLLQGFLTVLIIHFQGDPHFFILAYFVNGLTGQNTALMASCFSYLADISSKRWVSFRIGAAEGVMAFGKVAGQLLGGYWLYKINCNYIPPLMFCNAATALIYLYMCFLPESLDKEERLSLILRKKSSGKGGMILRHFTGFKSFLGTLPKRPTWSLYAAMIVIIIGVINLQGAFYIYVFFLKAPPFDFTPFYIGIYQASISFSQGLSSVFLIATLVALHLSDAWIMLIGILANGLGNLLTGFASKAWQLYAIAAFQGIQGTTFPAARGLTSKIVGREEQGSLFSIIASIESVASLLSTTIWPYVFPITLAHNFRSGTVFIFFSILAFMVIPVIISMILFNCKRPSRTSTAPSSTAPHKITASMSLPSGAKDSTTGSTTSSSEEEEYQPLLTSDKYSMNAD